MERLRWIGTGLSTVLVAGCASTVVPSQKLTDCKASVRAAEAVGAETHPQAALHLKMARDQVGEAEKLIEDDDNERARLVLERAEADAQLAMALAQEERARDAAQEAKRKVEKLKQKASP